MHHNISDHNSNNIGLLHRIVYSHKFANKFGHHLAIEFGDHLAV